MSEEDFDSLYKQLRGTSCATSVVDSLAYYREGNFEEALRLLKSAEATFRTLRQATLRKELKVQTEAERAALGDQDRRILKLQEKAFETLESLSKLQEFLGKKLARQKPSSSIPAVAPPAPSEATKSKPETSEIAARSNQPLATSTIVEERTQSPPTKFPATFLASYAALKSSREALKLAQEYFEIQSIEAEHRPVAGSLYLVQAGEFNFCFVKTSDPAIRDGFVEFRTAIEDQKVKPLALDKFIQAGIRQKICLLAAAKSDTGRHRQSSVVAVQSQSASRNFGQTGERVDANSDAQTEFSGQLDEAHALARDQILDMGAFSQLIESAQRCGLVPGIATIVQLRDCEFRLGRYQEALQTLESLFSAFTSSAASRTQQLMREDADIASGKLKMSPRDIQAKRVRDNNANDAIERARTRFSRVLEGLRLLVHNQESLASH